jgi:thioredoxin 1
MSALILEQHNRDQLARALEGETWVVACLCAAWCDVCREFQPAFEQLAAQFPHARVVWIDVEDQADLVGDIDVENFPTLLIQRGDTVAFYGTVLPDARLTARLLQSLAGKSAGELRAETEASQERRAWQTDCNLSRRLKAA